MADVYGVTPDDISAELPALFPQGFNAATRPSDALVTTWISRSDARVHASARYAQALDPKSAEAMPGMAKDYIIAFVKARVMQTVYAGNDPAALSAILAPAFGAAKDILSDIRALVNEHISEERTAVNRPLPSTVNVPTRYVP